MTALVILAVDPGARSTGIVLRQGDQLLDFALVERTGREDLPTANDLRQVTDTIRQLQKPIKPDYLRLAVESLNPPEPHMGMTNILGWGGTAMVLGAILDRWPHALVVPPGHHGDSPLIAYPALLRGPRERKGTGARRHLRSAWDIAYTAYITIRMQQRGRPA